MITKHVESTNEFTRCQVTLQKSQQTAENSEKTTQVAFGSVYLLDYSSVALYTVLIKRNSR